MGIEDVCPYCGTPRNSPQQLKKYLRGGSDLALWQGLLGVNFLLYVGPVLFFVLLTGPSALSFLMQGPPYQSVVGRLYFSGPHVFQGYWYGLFTANFLHANLMHILFNSYAIFVLTPHVVARTSNLDAWIIYILSGVGGFALSSFAGNLSLGASAAIFGFIGYIIGTCLADGSYKSDPIFSAAVQWAGFTFVFGLFVSGLDHYAHLGGLLTGGFLGSFWASLTASTSWKTLRRQIALVLVIVCIYCFARPFLPV